MFQKISSKLIYKKYLFKFILWIGSALILGCDAVDPINTAVLGVQAIQAIAVSDQEMKVLAEQGCKELDNKYRILGFGTTYYNRLNNLTKDLDQEIRGTRLNFKVYESNEMNAFALANGCVRIYSGLVDILDDDEIRSVLAHEIGHVALQHHKKSYRLMKASSVAISAAGAYTGLDLLNNELFQSALYSIVNSKFSQTQETQADNYSVDMMMKNHKPAITLATALQKIENAYMHKNSNTTLSYLFDDHPSTQARIKNIKNRIHLIEIRNLNKK